MNLRNLTEAMTEPNRFGVLIGSFALVAMALMVTIRLATALTLEPQPRVCSEYFRDELIFSGTVVDEYKVFNADGFLLEIIYDLRPIEFFKAEIQTDIPRRQRGTLDEVYSANFGDGGDGREPIVQVRTGVNSGGRYLDVGESYLLFAGVNNYTERYAWIGGGGNSSLLSEAEDTITEIRRIQTEADRATAGNVRGWIFNYSDPKVKNVRFVAIGEGQEFEAFTDPEGWFYFDLPPGSYRITPEPPLKGLRPFDLSYDDPENLLIKAGACNEVAFRFWK